jgi:hypothetical protein
MIARLAQPLPLVLWLLVLAQLGGCAIRTPSRRPPPGFGAGGTAEASPSPEAGPTASPAASPTDGVATALPPPAASEAPTGTLTATVTAPGATALPTEAPTATVEAELPLPGQRLPRSAWRTLVKAPGLPDMDPAGELGPESHFAVVTGNQGLNTLRAELRQPANAWVTGMPTDTLLIGTLLGLRRGDGHDLEVVDLAVDGGSLNVGVRLTTPGAWQGGGSFFPLHLVAVDRAALPAGPLTVRFLDASALAPGAAEPAFEVALGPVDPATDEVRRQTLLILQTASEGAP